MQTYQLWFESHTDDGSRGGWWSQTACFEFSAADDEEAKQYAKEWWEKYSAPHQYHKKEFKVLSRVVADKNAFFV